MAMLDIQGAAALLHISESAVYEKARNGDIPGAKPGKCWVFVEEDLIAYVRSLYRPNRESVQAEQKENVTSCSTEEKPVKSGGQSSPHQTEKKYSDLLGQKTNAKPRNLRIV